MSCKVPYLSQMSAKSTDLSIYRIYSVNMLTLSTLYYCSILSYSRRNVFKVAGSCRSIDCFYGFIIRNDSKLDPVARNPQAYITGGAARAVIFITVDDPLIAVVKLW